MKKLNEKFQNGTKVGNWEVQSEGRWPGEAFMSGIKKTDMNDVQEVIHEMYSQDVPRGVLSGICDLDVFLGGFREGELVVVGGRPSMGRTEFALSMVKYLVDVVPILYFSWEMSKEMVLRRLLCLEAGIDYLPPYALDEEAKKRLEKAGKKIAKGKLYFSESRDSALETLEKSISELPEMPKLIIVDYLQKVAFGMKKGEKEERIKELLCGLKYIGKKYGCAIIALSELSRKPDKRKDHVPLLSDIREVRIVEPISDIILLLNCDNYDHRNKGVIEADVLVARNRRGHCGSVPMSVMRGKYTDALPIFDLDEKIEVDEEFDEEFDDDLPFG